MCTPGPDKFHLLGQQTHQVVRGVGVQAYGRNRDVGGGVGPVLVVVLEPVQHGVRRGRLPVDHLTWREHGGGRASGAATQAAPLLVSTVPVSLPSRVWILGFYVCLLLIL